jgi:probable F420-dependent oxidoreductase
MAARMSDPLRLDEGFECGSVITAQDRASVLSLARRAEAAGFDSLWAGDHVSFYVPLLESLTLLSFVAAATERVKLGTAVYLVPLRHPTTTAKVAATLDLLSGGRLVLGVGVGGEFPPEFTACGVPVEERGSRANESIPLLRRLWTENGVTHSGRHFSFGPVSLDPKPVQPGGPPILVGGRKAPAFRRAGRHGDGYISHMCSPEMYGENLNTIRQHAERAGRRDVRFQTSAFLFTRLGDDYEECLKTTASTLQMVYNRPFEDAARKYCLLGRTDDCLEQLRAFARSGCRSFILSPLMDSDEFLERAQRDLLPHIRSIA